MICHIAIRNREIERLRAEIERLTKTAEENYELAIKEAARAEVAEQQVASLVEEATKFDCVVADEKWKVEKLRSALKPFADEFYNTHMIIPSISDGAVKIGITVLARDIQNAYATITETE